MELRYDEDGTKWHRHDAFKLRDWWCTACGAPGANLLVYRHRPSKRLFLMCEELDEGWWDPDAVANSPEMSPFQDLSDWRLATQDELNDSGWDTTRFCLVE